jgi:hypothetical protein
MEVKLGQLVDGLQIFEALASQYVFTSRVAYDLSKTLKSCREEAKEYDEQVQTVQKRFTIETGGKKIIDPEKLDDYKKEIKDLRDKVISIWGKAPITLKTLEDAIRLAHKQQKPEDKDFEPMFPPALFSELDWLIVMEEEEGTEAKAASA